MVKCSWYEPWRTKSDLLKIDACHLWDETNRKCLRNEECLKHWEKKRWLKR